MYPLLTLFLFCSALSVNEAKAVSKQSLITPQYLIEASYKDDHFKRIEKANTLTPKPSGFIGQAYDLTYDELVYIEEHSIDKAGNHNVIYKKPSGEIFAEKNVTYHVLESAPEIRQINHLNGELIEIKKQHNTYDIHYQETRKNEARIESIQPSKSLVIDAGFHRFIQSQWEALLNGNEFTIDYLLPTRLHTIKLTIKKRPCPESDNICFIVEANNWIYRLLSDPLHLSYNTHKQLLVFNGRSNISNIHGDYFTVKIQYHYPNH